MKKITFENIRAFSIKHWLKGIITLPYIKIFFDLARDIWLSKNLDNNDIYIIFLSYFLLLITADYFEKNILYKRIKVTHYPKSFNVVKNKILPSYIENSKSKSYKTHNLKRDRIIKSPIDYTYETLSGNEAPIFRPNESYLEEIFDNNNTHIISLTSENPNMWLDSTLNFYFVNTLAISLMRKFNNSNKSKLVIKDFINQNGYKNYISNESGNLLNDLKTGNNLNSFEFIRFFLFKSEQEECLKETIFPSLKASQDLFRLNSFFINKDNIPSILNSKKHTDYQVDIKRIWEKIISDNNINDEDSIEVINRRIKQEIPEFLILYKSNIILIHTYVNGKAYKTELRNENENGINYYATINNLVSLLAEYRIENKSCDWEPKETEHLLNSKKSYIDWE